MKFDIKSYIAESERQYHYRIKSIAPIDDAALDRIENCIMKYRPLEMSRPKKTMLQAHPLDFYDVTGAEVFILDLVTSLPASSYVLQQEVRNALNCPEKYVVVRGDNEPIEVEGEKMAALKEIDADAKAKGLTPKSLLASDPGEEPGESQDEYGDGYNAKFVDYLAKVKKDRPSMVAEPTFPILKSLAYPASDTASDGDAFNKDIDDAPRVYSTSRRRRIEKPGVNTSNQGNYDDDSRTYAKSFLNKSGKTKVISRTVGGMRGDT